MSFLDNKHYLNFTALLLLFIYIGFHALNLRALGDANSTDGLVKLVYVRDDIAGNQNNTNSSTVSTQPGLSTSFSNESTSMDVSTPGYSAETAASDANVTSALQDQVVANTSSSMAELVIETNAAANSADATTALTGTSTLPVPTVSGTESVIYNMSTKAPSATTDVTGGSQIGQFSYNNYTGSSNATDLVSTEGLIVSQTTVVTPQSSSEATVVSNSTQNGSTITQVLLSTDSVFTAVTVAPFTGVITQFNCTLKFDYVTTGNASNTTWSNDLASHDSQSFKVIEQLLSEQFQEILKNISTYRGLKLVSLREGSIIAEFQLMFEGPDTLSQTNLRSAISDGMSNLSTCLNQSCSLGGLQGVNTSSLVVVSATDPCLSAKDNICDVSTTTCVSNPNGTLSCVCKTGYQRNTSDIACTDINECLNVQACNVSSGVCENLNGSYRCSCLLGFAALDNHTCVGVCLENPCMNDGICTPTLTGFSCRCPEEWTGDACQIHNSVIQYYRTVAIAVGITFVTISIVLLLILIFVCLRLRRDEMKKNSDDRGNFGLDEWRYERQENGDYTPVNTGHKPLDDDGVGSNL